MYAYLALRLCRDLHGAARGCFRDGPRALYGPSLTADRHTPHPLDGHGTPPPHAPETQKGRIASVCRPLGAGFPRVLPRLDRLS